MNSRERKKKYTFSAKKKIFNFLFFSLEKNCADLAVSSLYFAISSFIYDQRSRSESALADRGIDSLVSSALLPPGATATATK